MYGNPSLTTTNRDVGVVPLIKNDTVQTFLKLDRVEPFYSKRDHSRVESSKSVRLEGRYFIGTYDHRPNEQDVPGAIQGDEHVGAMWSPPFVIESSKNNISSTISMLIGGGCNARDEKLELIVDGIGAARVATGQCDETMRRVIWNVDEFIGMSGIIRAVDNSKSLWGHINFDDIRFSWIAGDATSSSGSVFVFRRHLEGTNTQDCLCECVNVTTSETCVCDRSDCDWTQETKLVPSDLRTKMKFGSSVDVSGDVIVVGATKAAAIRGNIDEALKGAVYMFTRPQFSSSSSSYASWAVHGAYHVSSHTNRLEYTYDEASDLWSDEILKHNFGSHTTSYEFSKLTTSLNSFSLFGFSVSLRGYTLVAGAPSASTTPWKDKSGVVMIRDIESASTLTFSSRIYSVPETQESIDLYVYRTHYESTLRELDVMYSTSDITAKGVNSSMYLKCSQSFIEDRGLSCGDYEKAYGLLTFAVNQSSAMIRINITNDECRENETKEFRVNLGIVGNEKIDSHHYEAIVRVEDDDPDMAYCQR